VHSMRLLQPGVLFKSFITMLCVLLFSIPLYCQTGDDESTVSGAFGTGPVVYVNGSELFLDHSPVVRAGIIFLPLTDSLAYELDGDLEESITGGYKTVEFSSIEGVLEFTEGDTMYSSSGRWRELPEPPFVSSGILYVPLERFFTELGFDLEVTDDGIFAEKELAAEDLVEGIPESVLKGEVTGEKRVEEQAAGEELEEAVQEDKYYGVEYTYENKVEFVNVAVSGDSSQSNLLPQTDFYNDFSIRFMGELANGYSLRSTIKTNSTTDQTINRGELARFHLSFSKPGKSINLYDLTPKVSQFVLKNYILQGLEYNRDYGETKYTFLTGRTPKKLRESRYNRYVSAGRVERKFGEEFIEFTYVDVKDTGVTQPDQKRIANRVMSANSLVNMPLNFEMAAEFAQSNTRYAYGSVGRGNARRFELERKARDMNVLVLYERIGSGFVSETSFFSQGRREMSVLVNRRLPMDMTMSAGYRSVRMLGEATDYIPLMLRTPSPFSFRPDMKLKIQKDYEQSRGAYGPRINDKRKITITDRIGKARFNATLERRRKKDTYARWSFKTSQKYRYITYLTKQLELMLQYKHELRTMTSNPKKRYYQSKFIFEPKEWTEVALDFERYYNATVSDHTSSGLSYKSLDIMNDREYSLEYAFHNYRDHNDNVFKLTYSYYR